CVDDVVEGLAAKPWAARRKLARCLLGMGRIALVHAEVLAPTDGCSRTLVVARAGLPTNPADAIESRKPLGRLGALIPFRLRPRGEALERVVLEAHAVRGRRLQCLRVVALGPRRAWTRAVLRALEPVGASADLRSVDGLTDLAVSADSA